MEVTFLAVIVLIVISLSITGSRVYEWIRDRKPQRYDIGTELSIGKKQVQDDAFGLQVMKDGMMAVIADGEGKGYGGKVAAQISVRTFTKHYNQYDGTQRAEYFFLKAFKSANSNVINALQGSPGKASVAGIILEEDRLSYAIAGCIYIYIFRDKELVLLSRGQINEELIKERVNEGRISKEAALRLLGTNRTYSHIGKDDYEIPVINQEEIRLKKKDIIVMLTGGVYKSLSVREMEDILAKRDTCKIKAAKIIKAIQKMDLENQDNAGIILIGV